MMKTIYLSAAISDVSTGLPREGWQQQFRQAEEQLRSLGFGVISPVTLSAVADTEWAVRSANDPALPAATPRWFYLQTCIDTLCEAMQESHHADATLAGLLLVGPKQPLYHSLGVQTEIGMALSMGLPLFSTFYDLSQVDRHLLPVRGGLRLEPGATFGREKWSRYM